MITDEESELYGPLLVGFVQEIDKIIPRSMIRLPRGKFCTLSMESTRSGTISEATYQVKWFDGVEHRKLLQFNGDDNIQKFVIRVTESEITSPDAKETDKISRKRAVDGMPKESEGDEMTATVEILMLDINKNLTSQITITLNSGKDGNYFIRTNRENLNEMNIFIHNMNFKIHEDNPENWTDRTDLSDYNMIEFDPLNWIETPINEYAAELNTSLNENSRLMGDGTTFEINKHWTVKGNGNHFEGILDLKSAEIASMVPGFELHDTLKVIISKTQTFARLFLRSDMTRDSIIAKSHLVPNEPKYLEYYLFSKNTSDKKARLKQFIQDLSFFARHENGFESDEVLRSSGTSEDFIPPEVTDARKFRLDFRDNHLAVTNGLSKGDALNWTSNKRSLGSYTTECYYTLHRSESLIYPIKYQHEEITLFVKYITSCSFHTYYRIYLLNNHSIVKSSHTIRGIHQVIQTLTENFIIVNYNKVTAQAWVRSQYQLQELEAITDRLMRLT